MMIHSAKSNSGDAGSIAHTLNTHTQPFVLIGRHASLLYAPIVDSTSFDELRSHMSEFIADQQLLLEYVRHRQRHNNALIQPLQEEIVETNTRLLQFGDTASLQVSVPWPNQRTISMCPLDGQGEYVDIAMEYDQTNIRFDPWPYNVDKFEVCMEGWLLPQNTYSTVDEYHTALAEAPFYQRIWKVVKD